MYALHYLDDHGSIVTNNNNLYCSVMTMKLGQQLRPGWSFTFVALICGGLVVLPTSTVIEQVSAASTSDNATHHVLSVSNKSMQSANATNQATTGAAGIKSGLVNATKNKGESAAKTVNQSSKSSEQAAQSIRGAIVSTGQFLKNVTNKLAGSKSAQTLLNETSEALGNASTAAQKMFSSNK